LPGVAVAVFNAGWDMIGYQNPTLGLALWAVAAVLLAIPALYWFIGVVRERNRLREHSRESQEELQELKAEREELIRELDATPKHHLLSRGGSALYPLLQEHELRDRYFKNRTIYISDLAREITTRNWTNIVINGRTFEDCRIYGPAVLAPMNTGTLGGKPFDDECKFMDGRDVAWVAGPEEHGNFVGIVGLEDCTFLKCRFEQCGVLVPLKDYKGLRDTVAIEPANEGHAN